MTAAVVLAILVALAFALTNGFHDAANAIATLVATRVARPIPAVVLAATFNLIGPFVVGAAVANTTGKIVDLDGGQQIAAIGAGLTGATVWNLITWSRGIPSSSSHALVGGLVGAALLLAGPSAVRWGPVVDGHIGGVLGILVVLAVAPPVAAAAAFAVERIGAPAGPAGDGPRERAHPDGAVVHVGLARVQPRLQRRAEDRRDHRGRPRRRGAHPAARGRPAVGDPRLLRRRSPLGTAFGGWGIVRTIGRRIFPVHEVDGLVSQGTSASLILAASAIGAPVSTTQVVSSSIVGIGVGRRRYRHVGWTVVRDILVAWVTTIPAAAIIAAVSLPVWRYITA